MSHAIIIAGLASLIRNPKPQTCKPLNHQSPNLEFLDLGTPNPDGTR